MSALRQSQSRSGRPLPERTLSELLLVADWHWFVSETLGLLAIVMLVRPLLPDGLAGDGTLPHPFWIAVLLMSAQYGVMGGLFAALSASTAYLLDGLPAQSAMQDFYGYAGVVAVQPCAWCATALVLGGLRTLHIHSQTTLEDQLDQTSLTADALADALQSALREIDRLEQRIATDTTTSASLLDSLAKLDISDRRTLLTRMAEVIRWGVGATDFMICLGGLRGEKPYLVSKDGVTVEDTKLIETTMASPIAEEPASASLAVPIRQNASARSLGTVICQRLSPKQVPGIAGQRLTAVSCLLASLLPVCPDFTAEAPNDDAPRSTAVS
ncbi:MAG TPA: hypothetical protein VL614_08025 [Acetobacteraceae bacterium]|jgi:hypothetical protein|nr:hypothetical protein [Acetobacteraceae bacterium]